MTNAATTITVDNEADLHSAVAAAVDGDTVMMTADISTTKQVTITKEITFDGDGYTLSPQFTKTGNSNNSAIGIISADNVTIQNLTIDGSGGTDLHGINVYTSEGVIVNNVASNHNRSGLVVNGSYVTVTDFSTAGNAWHGINVAQGSGVTDPAILTISNTSSHGEGLPTNVPHIFIDDTAQNAAVNDVDGQYWSTEFLFNDNTARAYTLNPFGDIIEPEVNEVVTGETDLVATYEDYEGNNDEGVQWAVREGTCDVNTAVTVAGNVDGFNNPYAWDGHNFDAAVDTSSYTPGMHCFIFNPEEEGPNQPDVRETREFFVGEPLSDNSEDKNSCKKGGWEDYGFKNQGQCIKFVNTGKDSR